MATAKAKTAPAPAPAGATNEGVKNAVAVMRHVEKNARYDADPRGSVTVLAGAMADAIEALSK